MLNLIFCGSPNKSENGSTEKNNEGYIPKHGGYRNLITNQKAEIIYGATVIFISLFTNYDRTIGQRVQAVSSGKQNMAEAIMASGTSKEVKLSMLQGLRLKKNNIYNG